MDGDFALNVIMELQKHYLSVHESRQTRMTAPVAGKPNGLHFTSTAH